ncbi:MAG TPA: MFS transporter [Burkholderiaceae bacterium]|jgi:PAT family beta-lactamase induction signal transducer AmpG
MSANAVVERNPWSWIPSLYFAQGIPYAVVMALSVAMYKTLGISNTEIAFYTSWLYLPWVVKPLWSPLAELIGTKRGWIWALQFCVAVALALVALTLPGSEFFRMSLAVLWLMAFASASHDIAADGFYLLAQDVGTQAAFIGVRSTCYRLANISVQGGLVALAGHWQKSLGNTALAWSFVFWILAAAFALLGAWHWRVLPRPLEDKQARIGGAEGDFWPGFVRVFALYFKKPGILVTLGFLLLYRFPEAQLLKLAVPFLLDNVGAGGLGLSTEAVGLAYGTVGVAALTLGGLLGGWVVSRFGLKRVLWPLVLVMHIPNLVFVLLAQSQTASLPLICTALAVEQFGYGLGFTAYMMYMVLVAEGQHKTAHYAICTGFMALGMMLPGMWSGWLQQQLGYFHFFGWVLICTLPSLIMAAFIKIPDDFGIKKKKSPA